MYKITKGLSFLPTQTLDISMLFSLQLLNMLNMLKLFNLVLVLLKVTNILYQFVSQYFPGFFLVIVIISFPQIICVDLQRVVGRFNPLKPGLQPRALCVYFINSWSTLLNWPIASLLIFFFSYYLAVFFLYITIIYALLVLLVTVLVATITTLYDLTIVIHFIV